MHNGHHHVQHVAHQGQVSHQGHPHQAAHQQQHQQPHQHHMQNQQPQQLSFPLLEHCPQHNNKWHSNQEVAQLLWSALHRSEWLHSRPALRPHSGRILFFKRMDGVWFKSDGYEWKRRRQRKGQVVREDHMKLKVLKQEIISANYAHSAVVPSFHRRSYWLTENPDVVLVHYLNVPEEDKEGRPLVDRIAGCIRASGLSYTHAQLCDQIRPILSSSLHDADISSLCGDVWASLNQLPPAEVSMHDMMGGAMGAGPMGGGVGEMMHPQVMQQYHVQAAHPHTPNIQIDYHGESGGGGGGGGGGMYVDEPSGGHAAAGVAHPRSVHDGTPPQQPQQQPLQYYQPPLLERRNSCSSSLRRPLCSSSLRRQPSAFSDSVDACYADMSISSVPPREEGGGGESHSADTQRSSYGGGEGESVIRAPRSAHSYGSMNGGGGGGGELTPIVDMAPAEGGVRGGTRVLVVGAFYLKGHDYSLLFGERRVAARMVQAGVLGAVTPPAASLGPCRVRVLCDGAICSTAGEYVYTREAGGGGEEDDAGLLERCRLQAIVDRVQVVCAAFGGVDRQELSSCSLDESSLVDLLRGLRGRDMVVPELLSSHSLLPSRTLLHAAAAADWHAMLDYLLWWRTSLPFTRELDPLARDADGRTALHVAAAGGCARAAASLVRACAETRDAMDERGRTPCDLSTDPELIRLTRRDGEEEEARRRGSSAGGGRGAGGGGGGGKDPVAHVTSTALWVLTNGETVTNEMMLRGGGGGVERYGEEDDHCAMSEDEENEEEPGPSIRKHPVPPPPSLQRVWPPSASTRPLHVEISMDTNVHLPDSPKMVELFHAVTSPGAVADDGARAKMALLAQQIIDALPERIKTDTPSGLLCEDGDETHLEPSSLIPHDQLQSSSNPLLNHGEWSEYLGEEEEEEEGQGGQGAEGGMSAMAAQTVFRFPSHSPSSGGDRGVGVGGGGVGVGGGGPHSQLIGNGNQLIGGTSHPHHLHPSRSHPASLSFASSSRTATFDSGSADFDRDLGEFFSRDAAGDVDPIGQRLGDLKLSDGEQREVYEAAQVIQRAYREYRARNTCRRQADLERRAAVTIQCCYRRYKQFIYFKKLHNAAIVVQQHFRLKKNQRCVRGSVPAGARSGSVDGGERMEGDDEEEEEEEEERERRQVPEHPTVEGGSIKIQVPPAHSWLLREHRAALTIQHAYRGHRKRQAAARKIQQFMRTSKHNVNDMHHLTAQDARINKRRRVVCEQPGGVSEEGGVYWSYYPVAEPRRADNAYDWRH